MPKVDAGSLQPASWAAAAAQEWCPPGHGDLYAAIAGSGTLSALLAAGYKYLFVSNSDNLGATLDLDILTYFAQTDAPFMMEVRLRSHHHTITKPLLLERSWTAFHDTSCDVHLV